MLRRCDDRGGSASVSVRHHEAGVVLVSLSADLSHLQPPVAVADEVAWEHEHDIHTISVKFECRKIQYVWLKVAAIPVKH